MNYTDCILSHAYSYTHNVRPHHLRPTRNQTHKIDHENAHSCLQIRPLMIYIYTINVKSLLLLLLYMMLSRTKIFFKKLYKTTREEKKITRNNLMRPFKQNKGLDCLCLSFPFSYVYAARFHIYRKIWFNYVCLRVYTVKYK